MARAPERREVDLVERIVEQAQGDVLDGFDQERVAGREVVHKGALGDAGALGDVARRESGVAVLDEALDRRVQQRAARERSLFSTGAAGRGDYRRARFTVHVIDDGIVPFIDHANDEIRGSRMRRAAKLTGAAAGVAAREATARALNATARPRHAAPRASKQQLKSAQSLVKVFSGMRGAAMKVGQTLSAVDLGLVPEEIRPEFQEILATLQQGAEPVSFKAIAKVVEEDLGEKLNEAFADFEPEPIAAASIGQVHRADAA